MSLTSQISNRVNSRITNRGRSYFKSGAVSILEGDESEVIAVVKGIEKYEVSLFREGRSVEAFCSCHYFDANLETCEHIWATLLQAEVDGFLSGSKNAQPLLDITVEDEDRDDCTDDDDEDFGDDWDFGDEEDELDYSELLRLYDSPSQKHWAQRRTKRAAPSPPSWKAQLSSLRGQMEASKSGTSAWSVGREILYIVDVEKTLRAAQGLSIEVVYRERKMDGDWGVPKPHAVSLEQIHQLPDPADREILSLLAGARHESSYSPYYYATPQHVLPSPMLEIILPMMCSTGRCWLRRSQEDKDLESIRWDDGEPWEFLLKVALAESGKEYRIEGALQRDGQELALSKPILFISGGVVFCEDWATRFMDYNAFDWVMMLRENGSLSVPAEQKADLLKELHQMPRLPKLVLPKELEYEEVSLTPSPRLKVRAQNERWVTNTLLGELSFDYDGHVVPEDQPSRGVYVPEERKFILRCPDAENAATERLTQLGFRNRYGYRRTELQLTRRHLPRVVRTLLDEGWYVEAEGKVYRKPGMFDISVSSGIDWFELHGSVEFGERSASLPELLKALQKGENTVRLDDGTLGILPEEWLKKYGTLAGLGTPKGKHLRFRRSQVGILDALLASQPEASFDEVFVQARDELKTFQGVEATDPPSDFVGELRGYQRDGLGWLYFLQKFGFGGCLADDMGLGKTIQALALLESRRVLRAKEDDSTRPAPSLIVVPRSLVFNWKQEAARFTPKLSVLDHTGPERSKEGSNFKDYDVVVTTYGTLRNDIPRFKDVQFDYCILDESQMIKNHKTASAKAARLVQADYKLALSGTPIENHLGELWSLFEFLNPGMLGRAAVFGLTGSSARNPEEETRELLSQALRPFILRRTKDQVAKDLPPKTEQTIYCDLDSTQRKLYDELREHYRLTLLDRVERDGLNRSKIHILEALLRLRQAAIHPGLIDKSKTKQSSAKLDTLLPQLGEVFEEGHKALVFSQFTQMLAIVRDRLDRENVPYQYLDGRTRKRGERIEHFQTDPNCKLFLISLKAGGLGLNLTAAEYVFLLDPWWNPAVEAQAIDRTHRIGQTHQVFAYRLIARDTVEEKVLELQQTKRDLADAIINADNSLIRDLKKEDLALLLS